MANDLIRKHYEFWLTKSSEPKFANQLPTPIFDFSRNTLILKSQEHTRAHKSFGSHQLVFEKLVHIFDSKCPRAEIANCNK